MAAYICIEKTEFRGIREPGFTYTPTKEEEVLFEKNPCWQAVYDKKSSK